jgi:3',5'-cyclic AMP phosphodiesterase CpdA
MNRRRFIKSVAGAMSLPLIARAASHRESFEIGLVADAQYADVDPSPTRFYRKSIERLHEAVDHFNGRPLAFCVHLGDLIDRDWKSFDAISAPLAESRHPWHQLLGNHDFEVLDAEKPRVPGRLGMAWRYGTFVHRDFRFVVLDTNDVSTYAHAAGTPERTAADQRLAKLQAAKVPEAKPWNGAVGPTQLAWLDRTCAEARQQEQRVIILAHHPVFPANEHNLWNAAEVLAVLDRHRHVVAWLNGHNHAGNFGERDGLPFVNLHGMVETPGPNAFATANLLADRLIITGHGREPSRELKFRT